MSSSLPSPQDAAGKVGNALAPQASAKEFKKESTAARFLGAGNALDSAGGCRTC
jgi:hypothetical protein